MKRVDELENEVQNSDFTDGSDNDARSELATLQGILDKLKGIKQWKIQSSPHLSYRIYSLQFCFTASRKEKSNAMRRIISKRFLRLYI